MQIPAYNRSQGIAGMIGGRGMIVLAVLALLGLWWIINQQDGVTGRSQMITTSVDDEMQMGLDAYAQVLQEQPVLCARGANSCRIEDGQLVDEVRDIGRALEDAAKRWEADGAVMTVKGETKGHLPAWGKLADRFNWQFNVIESTEVNAFALPGGYVAVYSGIAPVAQNPSGLAAVMGHEIGHALARHGGERMSQQQVMSFGQLAVGAVFGGMGLDTQRMVMGAFGVASDLGVLKPFSRAQESEADMIGLELMVRACFDPRETPKLWRRMAALGGAGPEILSTHPDPEARAKAFEAVMPTAIAAYHKHCVGALPPG